MLLLGHREGAMEATLDDAFGRDIDQFDVAAIGLDGRRMS